MSRIRNLLTGAVVALGLGSTACSVVVVDKDPISSTTSVGQGGAGGTGGSGLGGEGGMTGTGGMGGAGGQGGAVESCVETPESLSQANDYNIPPLHTELSVVCPDGFTPGLNGSSAENYGVIRDYQTGDTVAPMPAQEWLCYKPDAQGVNQPAPEALVRVMVGKDESTAIACGGSVFITSNQLTHQPPVLSAPDLANTPTLIGSKAVLNAANGSSIGGICGCGGVTP